MFKFVLISIMVAAVLILMATEPVRKLLQALLGLSVLVWLSAMIGGIIYLSLM